MKSSFRIRFLRCFKPETSPGNMLRRNLSDELEEHLTYRDIAEESSSSPPSRKGALSHAVKAVLFKTILAGRVRERRRRGLSKSYRSINCKRTITDFLDDDVIQDDNTSISRVRRLPSLSEPHLSLDQLPLLSESPNGVTDRETKAQGKSARRRRRRMISGFIVVLLAATVFLGRSWAMLLASAWICITSVYISFGRRNRETKQRPRHQPILKMVEQGKTWTEQIR